MIRARGRTPVSRYKQTTQRYVTDLTEGNEVRMPKTAFQINLMVDGADGAGVYVRSNDVPGLHLVGKSLSAMKGMIEEAIKLLFRLNRGQEVSVVWLADVGSFKSKNPKAETLAVYPVPKAA
jgi:predicted RNase H-like HicB family nuclease